jgi:NTE family protein
MLYLMLFYRNNNIRASYMKESLLITQPNIQGKKIGLALGSGSARGLAHIGVLRAIEENGIKIDLIAGSSIGALIGAVYAGGELTALETSFKTFDWKKLVSLLDLVLPKSGLIDGKKVMEFVSSHLIIKEIEALPIPFQAVATDILTAEQILISEGDIANAIRASIAVPGIFTPVYDAGRILVDGGLVDPVPVSVVRAMGADFVIAIDLNHATPFSQNKKPLPQMKKIKVSPYSQKMDNLVTHTSNDGSYQTMVTTVTRIKQAVSTLDHSTSTRLKKWLGADTTMNIFEIILSSINIMAAKISENRMKIDRPELIIQPPLGEVHFLAFDQSEKIIELGYQSALEALSTINLVTPQETPNPSKFN